MSRLPGHAGCSYQAQNHFGVTILELLEVQVYDWAGISAWLYDIYRNEVLYT